MFELHVPFHRFVQDNRRKACITLDIQSTVPALSQSSNMVGVATPEKVTQKDISYSSIIVRKYQICVSKEAIYLSLHTD
jgi:hypothetical protein